MRKSLLFILTAALLLAGCSSFPANESGSDGLFLVPIVFDKSIPGEVFGSIQLTISDADGNYVISKKFGANQDYGYVRLEPGKYSVTRQVFMYDSNKKFGDEEMTVPFEIVPGNITVYRDFLLYRFYRKASVSNTVYMHYEFQRTTPEVQGNLIAELEKQESFGTWNIEFQ